MLCEAENPAIRLTSLERRSCPHGSEWSVMVASDGAEATNVILSAWCRVGITVDPIVNDETKDQVRAHGEIAENVCDGVRPVAVCAK